AHQLHGPGLVLVAEDRLPLPPVLPRESDFGDPLGQEALALGVLPKDGLQLTEGLQDVIGSRPVPMVNLVRHSVFCSLLLLILAHLRTISGQHVLGSSNRSVVLFVCRSLPTQKRRPRCTRQPKQGTAPV